MKLSQLSVEHFLATNMALLVDTMAGSDMQKLGPMILKRLHDPNWEVRDSTVELLASIAKISMFSKYQMCPLTAYNSFNIFPFHFCGRISGLPATHHKQWFMSDCRTNCTARFRILYASKCVGMPMSNGPAEYLLGTMHFINKSDCKFSLPPPNYIFGKNKTIWSFSLSLSLVRVCARALADILDPRSALRIRGNCSKGGRSTVGGHA